MSSQVSMKFQGHLRNIYQHCQKELGFTLGSLDFNRP